MKRLYIIIALVLWGCAQMASAQNLYIAYQHSIHPRSAVSVVHSNGYVYFFQADGQGLLASTQLDPITMMPLNTTVPDQMLPKVYLNGAFEDHNGDIVLFGYDNSNYNWKALYIIVNHFLSSYKVFQCNILGQFVAGCEGYDINNAPVYMMVTSSGKLYVIDYNTQYSPNMLFPVTFSYFELHNQNRFDNYTDISWDNDHEMFIATGSIWNGVNSCLHPFVDIFKCDLSNNTIISQTTYLINNQSYTDVSEAQALHIKLSNNFLLLYQDLRFNIGDTSTYDVIWMTRIKDYWNSFASIDESMFYKLPNTKLSAKDMLYDLRNNRLNLLGEFNCCWDLQLLAQVDPYYLHAGINIGQLGIGFYVTDTCPNLQLPADPLYANDMIMCNLALNIHHPCHPVLAAGLKDPSGILTETYDISQSSCDELLWYETIDADPILKPYSLNYSNIPDPPTSSDFSSTNAVVSVYKLCADTYNCFPKDEERSLKKPLTNGNPDAEVFVDAKGQFVCEGFDGKIVYSLYDMAGRVLLQGTTQNDAYVQLHETAGLYVLEVYDSANNHVVKKVVLM